METRGLQQQFSYILWIEITYYTKLMELKKIADNTLVAITLMTAESRPQEKDIIVKVLVNLINGDN